MRTSSQRTKTLTITEAAVLSLLAIEGESSGYDLLRQARKSVANIWAPAKTQLYAVLPRLVAAGLATQRAVVQERRPDKQLYRITPAGREALQRWLDDPDDTDRSAFFLRLFVGGLADHDSLRRPRRALPRAGRRGARAAARDRPHQHAHRPRRLPLVPARARDRGVRAADPLGRARARVARGARSVRLRLVVAAAAGGAALTLGACASAAPHPAVSGSWRGTFVLPTLASVSAEFSGGRVTVTLPAGHPAPTRVAATLGPGGRRALRPAGPADAARLQRPPARPCDSGHGDAGWAPRDVRAPTWQAARDRQPRRLPARLRRPAVRHAAGRPAAARRLRRLADPRALRRRRVALGRRLRPRDPHACDGTQPSSRATGSSSAPSGRPGSRRSSARFASAAAAPGSPGRSPSQRARAGARASCSSTARARRPATTRQCSRPTSRRRGSPC